MLITDTLQMKNFADDRRIWQGIPGIERTKGGRLLICFYSGKGGETFGNYALVMRTDFNGDFGNEPIAVAYAGDGERCFDPVIWIDPSDRLWFIWSRQPQNQVWGAICEDPDAENMVWGEEFLIGRGVMMNKPTVLTTGEWLFPIALWKPNYMSAYRDPATDIPDKAYAVQTVDGGKSFTVLGGANLKDKSFDEHMIYERKDGTLATYVRTAYGIGVTYSHDRGISWTEGEDSGLGGPCSRFHIKKLRSGRTLLINHYNYTGRNNLTALLSEDDGKTYPYTLLLDGRDSVSYPDAVEGDDGYIYIVYDRQRGCCKDMESALRSAREVLVAKITEDDIINGKLQSADGYLARVASKLGALSPQVDTSDFYPKR